MTEYIFPAISLLGIVITIYLFYRMGHDKGWRDGRIDFIIKGSDALQEYGKKLPKVEEKNCKDDVEFFEYNRLRNMYSWGLHDAHGIFLFGKYEEEKLERIGKTWKS